jgi:hypothetical protein
LNEFNVQYQSMNANITLLDPRFNLKSNHWKDEGEKSNAKTLLMNSVEEVVCHIANVATQNISMPSCSSSSDKSDNENAIDLFSSCCNDGSSVVDSSLSATTSIEQAKTHYKLKSYKDCFKCEFSQFVCLFPAFRMPMVHSGCSCIIWVKIIWGSFLINASRFSL